MIDNFDAFLRIMEAEQQAFIEKRKHMPPPKYKKGDVVTFEFDSDQPPIQGMVEIVDAYGTFEQNVEPSYDIYRFENNTLYKHVRESLIQEFIREGSLDEIEENIQKHLEQEQLSCPDSD